MLVSEHNYDFRKRMRQIHKKSVRDYTAECYDNEYAMQDFVTLQLDESVGMVTETAVRDFCEYLFTSMGIVASMKKGIEDLKDTIIVKRDNNLGDYAVYKGYRIEIMDKIVISGYDERGIMQALYNLEDILNARRAPFLKKGTYFRKPMFSPSMVHSGYGLDEYPDEYLARIAHEGRDAILVFTKAVNLSPAGFLDFNELIERTARFGIDVYAYSYIKSDKHPDEPEAEEYYENSYGELFKQCPGLKGVTLVGESVEFPSRDEHVSGTFSHNNAVDGIPTGKVSCGWYPCADYKKWLSLIKRIITKHNSAADIVFWTYNWGYQPEDARIKLINSLPVGITLLVTFEMVEAFKIKGAEVYCADYTLFFEGPGMYFKSEAAAAAKRGIKLYAMTNTGGLTWDFGTVPYLPMPYQWIKRYKAMQDARDEWTLTGLMESHHYGFYPSFISKLSKWILSEPRLEPQTVLKTIIGSEFGFENVEEIDKALKLWSESITYYTPTDADQYGAFRVGPAYPFCLDKEIQLMGAPHAMFGNRICSPNYIITADEHKSTYVGLRILYEIESLEKMRELFENGVVILDAIKDKNQALMFLVNQGHFMLHAIQTGINAKKWFCLKSELLASRDKYMSVKLVNDMEALLKSEIKNAEEAIPYAEFDSRLGWEPSMEYLGDACHIKWKIRQVNYVLNFELNWYREAVERFDLEPEI